MIPNDWIFRGALVILFIEILVIVVRNFTKYMSKDDNFHQKVDSQMDNQKFLWSLDVPVHDGTRQRIKYLCRSFLDVNIMVPSNSFLPNLRPRQLEKKRMLRDVGQSHLAPRGETLADLHQVTVGQEDSNPYEIPENCSPDSPAAEELVNLFPKHPRSDLVRFLIARKGDVSQAAEMVRAADEWKSINFPVDPAAVTPAVETNSLVPYGHALDGTQVIYFRAAFYDPKVTTEMYVLYLAHVMNFVFTTSETITFLCHTSDVKGAPNAAVDVAFVKAFVKVMSDNFPERLKRLIIFPFPWYGRLLWSIIRLFLDKRTVDKVTILNCADNVLPDEVLQYIDIDEIPEFCCGQGKAPPLDILTTFKIQRPSLLPRGAQQQAASSRGQGVSEITSADAPAVVF